MVIIRTNYDGQESPMQKKNTHTSFVEIDPLVPEKEIFEGFFFFTIYEYGGHLGHMTIIMLKKIISLYPKATKFGSKWPSSL